MLSCVKHYLAIYQIFNLSNINIGYQPTTLIISVRGVFDTIKILGEVLLELYKYQQHIVAVADCWWSRRGSIVVRRFVRVLVSEQENCMRIPFERVAQSVRQITLSS